MKVIANPQHYQAKEDLYINVRSAEGRVINNDVLKTLPFVQNNHPQKKEWDMRAKNYQHFVKHLKKSFTNQSLHILDIGCGNGWMSHRLAGEGHVVTGLDLNLVELEQAEETFGQSANLEWVYADILKDKIEKTYDVILFGASCQYFPNLSALLNSLAPILNKGGEIHFYDSIFYNEAELQQARQRSIDYYTNLGHPQMAEFYFHHSQSALKSLGFINITPTGFFHKKSPLQWWMKRY